MKNDVRIWHILSYSPKVSLTMKLTTILLLVSVFSIQANTYSQKVKITCNLENVKITEVFEEIEKNTEFKFLYNHGDIDMGKVVSVEAENKVLGEVLKELFSETNISFKVRKKQIILRKAGKNLTEKSVEAGLFREKYLEEQEIVVNGIVYSEDGLPLPGASIIIKGTTKGVISDLDGVFEISLVEGATTLVFSYLGFATKEINVIGKNNIKVYLVPSASNLDEIVVVGYGTVKKSDITGSVSSVGSDELAAFPSQDAIQALQGRAAGVSIQANNGGEPGSDFSVRVRGATSIYANSEPLYVVDGFPQGFLPAADDIESIEILKDASATAIYGSRGANGVIMITTKRGKTGPLKVNFNMSYSAQTVSNKLDLLDATQFAAYKNDIDVLAGRAPSFSNIGTLGKGTDWQDEIYHAGGVQNYGLNVSGGNENIDYYVSGLMYDQSGVIINSNFKRYSLTSNVNFKISDKVRSGVNILARRAIKEGIESQEGSSGVEGSGVVTTALGFPSTVNVYDTDGSFTLMPYGDPLDNPVANATGRSRELITDYLQANLFSEFDLFKNLKYKISLGVTTANGREGEYVSTTLLAGRNIGGKASVSSSKRTNTLLENYLTYSTTLNEDHSLLAMGGYSYQSFSTEVWATSAAGFLTDAVSWWGLGGAETVDVPFSSLRESELASFYGRLNYGFKNRYLLTANLRYDGSSRLAEGNKWAFFPSGAFAWNIHNEQFLENSKALSQFKVRTSYGITGNQSIAPYESLATLGYVFSSVNSQIVNAVRPNKVANNELTWETTAQLNLGLDLGLFNDKIQLTADYYRMTTSDLLFQIPLPEYSGFSSQLTNIGEVENKGVEFSLTFNDVVKTINWDTSLNFSSNKNKIIELPDDGIDILYSAAPGNFPSIQDTHVLREGSPVGSFYGYVYEGVQQNGNELLVGAEGIGGERFRDIENDGELTSDDRMIIGNPHPDFIWGWNNDFSYKGFDLNIFFQGSQGNDILNFSGARLDLGNGLTNATTNMLNRWSPTFTNTNVPQGNEDRSLVMSSRWVEDASYARLKNILLGYSFSENFLNKIKLRSLKVYVSAQNLLTITGYSGLDPEVNYRDSNTSVGLDYGSYPNIKSYTLGLNIGL